MGYGYEVKCKECEFSSYVFDDYGGLYDYCTFECKDCKQYFTVKLEHLEERYDDRPRGLLAAFMAGYKPVIGDVSCSSCGGENIERISYQDEIDLWENSKIKRQCPKCKHILSVSSGFWFDD